MSKKQTTGGKSSSSSNSKSSSSRKSTGHGTGNGNGVVPRQPASRSLRGYAFDPSLSQRIDTATINEIIYQVPWENLQRTKADPTQGPGPVGEYIEVIDYDPTVKKFYAPVDLNERYPLAMDGLDPSEANPQFHQQMVYAVAMTTISNFETALGRSVLWAARRRDKGGDQYVQRLRIYPHALREGNAYYSPQKKALLFGYFAAKPVDITLHMPEALTFTCLSHDIIAHETTHAILDGMYPYYNEASNPDVLAFHEAFADIVALFQHFTFPEVLKHQIAKTRGDLASQNLLGQLAQEFGTAIGGYGSLRDAIGEHDPVTGEWKPREPKPSDYESTLEPHQRGSILVAAVFEAFLNAYKSEVADLLRIASNGTGILTPGELHPDLVNRLAREAAACSQRVLHMCIRALDYCPPVDLTYGDYLRGIITADVDLKKDDQRPYRLAFIEAFARRGIYPGGIKAHSVDSIAYPQGVPLDAASRKLIGILGEFLREYRNIVINHGEGDDDFKQFAHLPERERIYHISREFSRGSHGLHGRISFKFGGSNQFQRITGLAWIPGWENLGVSRSYGGPAFWISNLRLVSRASTKGKMVNNIVFSIIQRAGVRVSENDEITPCQLDDKASAPPDVMIFRGGCTMVFDLDTLELKYVISKPLVDAHAPDGVIRLDRKRVLEQYEYQFDTGPQALAPLQQYFGIGLTRGLNEPFAMLHQH